MNIAIVASPTRYERCTPYAEGLKKFFSEPCTISFFNSLDMLEEPSVRKDFQNKNIDIAICWGGTSALRVNTYFPVQCLVLEYGHFKPRDNYQMTWHYISGRGDNRNDNCPSDRWDKMNFKLKPWQKNKDGHILFGLQMLNDHSLCHYNCKDLLRKGRFNENISNVRLLREIMEKFPDRKIYVRQHPRYEEETGGLFWLKQLGWLDPDQFPKVTFTDYKQPIEKDLKNCYLYIAINSTSTIESLIEGIPVHNIDRGSMTWWMGSQGFIKNAKPIYPDRKQWAYNMAYTCWSENEMQEAFKHLFKRS